jgi:hypothetical protein
MKNLMILLKPFTIPIVLALFAFFGLVANCNNQKTETVNDTTEIDDLRAFLIDSVQSAEMQINIAEMQAEKEKTAKETAQYKANANWYKNKYVDQKDISDSLAGLIPKTDTACFRAIASKQIEINYLDSALTECDNEAIGYSKQLFLCENQSNLKDISIENKNLVIAKLSSDIDVLTKSNKRNWFERNKIWICFLAGVGTAGYILK